MNEKIKAILVKLALEMKKNGWNVGDDPELSIQSEQYIPMVKNVQVHGELGNEEWNDVVQTHVNLKIKSDDEITYFPEYLIYGTIFIQGGTSKDMSYGMDVDAAFTANDTRNDSKISDTAKKINRIVDDHVQDQYTEYVFDNAEDINAYRQGGWKADDDSDR